MRSECKELQLVTRRRDNPPRDARLVSAGPPEQEADRRNRLIDEDDDEHKHQDQVDPLEDVLPVKVPQIPEKPDPRKASAA